MALGLYQPLNRNEYQEYFLGGKGGRCVGLTIFPHSCADCLEIWEPQTPGTLRACPCLYRVCFTFHLISLVFLFSSSKFQYARPLTDLNVMFLLKGKSYTTLNITVLLIFFLLPIWLGERYDSAGPSFGCAPDLGQ